jgi:hypothetical protein
MNINWRHFFYSFLLRHKLEISCIVLTDACVNNKKKSRTTIGISLYNSFAKTNAVKEEILKTMETNYGLSLDLAVYQF